MNVFSGRGDAELFRQVIAQGPDAVIVTDLKGVIQIWNTAAVELLGYSENEAIGRSLDIIIPEHLRQAHWDSFGKAMTSGITKYGGQVMKTRATHKSGEKRYVNFAFSILRDHEDKIIGAVATAREVTDK